MRCTQTKFVQAAFFGVMASSVAMAGYHRLTRSNSIVSTTLAASTATADAAAALRSISGTTRPSKAWVTDLNAFTAGQPGQWTVGRSSCCLSRAEAQQSARADAARSVCDAAFRRVELTTRDQRWLADRVQSDIQSGKLVRDDLTEQFDRPYGTIWTDSVLLDVSPEKMDGLLGKYHDEMLIHRERTKAIEFAAGAAIFTVWFAYLLCNVITRGYFSLRLRMIAGTVTAIALIVLLGGP